MKAKGEMCMEENLCTEETILSMKKEMQEMKKSINYLLEWADAVYQFETNRRELPRIIALHPKDNQVPKEEARFCVECGGERAYY